MFHVHGTRDNDSAGKILRQDGKAGTHRRPQTAGACCAVSGRQATRTRQVVVCVHRNGTRRKDGHVDRAV